MKAETKGEKKTVLLFKDLSKFGTFVNNKKIETQNYFVLEEDSILKFSKDFEYVVQWIPTVFCCSGLKKKEVAHIKQLVGRIGTSSSPSPSPSPSSHNDFTMIYDDSVGLVHCD